jgi:hypothetical protein
VPIALDNQIPDVDPDGRQGDLQEFGPVLKKTICIENVF